MAQNAAGELPEQSAQAYAKYLELCPNAKDGPELQASITLLRRAAQENDPERRRVTYAMLLFERGQVAEAHAVFARAALPQKGNPTGEIAAYYQVLTLARLGELEKAFQAGEAFLRQYGASADYENALRAEFDVGVQLLLKDKEEGLKAMDAVFEHSPQGALADNALLEKGRYLLRHGEFIEAKRLFEDVLEKYPGRESCAEALFRLGQARLRQYNYHPERQAILAKAREAFELYLRQYPQGPFVPHAQRLVKQCREFEAEHLWTVAQFYLNRAEPDAAAVYMRAISTDYADTAAAEKARTWLKERGSNP
jgi:outer membrane assembly lipoprotein YfiO